MNTIPNYTGASVTIKATDEPGFIRRTQTKMNGVMSVIFHVETEDGRTLELRPDQVIIDKTK